MTVFDNLFAIFLTAHLAGDFLLQTRTDVETKQRKATLIKHGAIHAALILLISGTWNVWLPALVIAATHAAVDYGKQRLTQRDWKAFLLDQGLHVLILLIVAALSVRFGLFERSGWEQLFGGGYFQALALVGGLIATVTAGAYFVDLAVEPFLVQIRTGRTESRHAEERGLEAGERDFPPAEPGFPAAERGFPSAERDFPAAERGFVAAERAAGARLRGLRGGGKAIGQLERALIFVFVLINQFSAIGFLIAAKSIFRFGELRDRSNRMEAEYIIIGTLISFLWAIVAALLTRFLGGF